MLKRQRQIKSFGIGLLLLGMLLWPLPSRAQGVCFDDATAGRMVVALEQARISEAQLQAQAGGNAELLAQVDILKGTIKLMQDQIEVYKSMGETMKAMGETKDKLCAEQIKAATPTFMDNVKTYTFGAGIGAALLGVILILL